MREHFKIRTHKHIASVRENLFLFEGVFGLSKSELELRGLNHDHTKFEADEENAYVWLSWMYQMRLENPDFSLPESIFKQIQVALSGHATKHAHHPEYHENPNHMQLLDVVEMICDWTAIAEENHGAGMSCRKWAQENLDKKWSFSIEMKELIYKVISEMETKKMSFL